MLELTGMGSVLRGIGILYWALAIGAVSLAVWKGKNWQWKMLWVGVAVVAFGFLPGKMMIEQAQRNAYAREAWAYFKKKCDTEAGEKIYKTYTGVKSVLVITPLPPATENDLFNQFWYGDPYSNATPWGKRGESAALMLASRTAPVAYGRVGQGYDFVEMWAELNSIVVRYQYPAGSQQYRTSTSDKPTSRFGISWEDISTPEDRKYWIAGSRLSVIDLAAKTVVAERIGYLIEAGFGSTAGQRRPWLTARGMGFNGRSCPNAHDYSDRWFLLKVLKPESGSSDGK